MNTPCMFHTAKYALKSIIQMDTKLFHYVLLLLYALEFLYRHYLGSCVIEIEEKKIRKEKI